MAPLSTQWQRCGGENVALARLGDFLPAPPRGETWAGDDAAVVGVPGGGALLLLATDCLVVGLDADLDLTTLADLGWKALAVNLSDIAAMGGRPGHALVSVVGLGADGLNQLYDGLLAASREYRCPVVGGDLSGAFGAEVVVNVAVTGWCDGPPVLRSGAQAGDLVWVTGPLGAAAAGLRLLRQAAGGRGPGGAAPAALAGAHARPQPQLRAGEVARAAGATAMIDVSDGFALDLGRLARSSGVGADLSTVPVAEGATLEEALQGGDDYALIFTCSNRAPVGTMFEAAGLPAPTCCGECTNKVGEVRLAGVTLEQKGWEHST